MLPKYLGSGEKFRCKPILGNGKENLFSIDATEHYLSREGKFV